MVRDGEKKAGVRRGDSNRFQRLPEVSRSPCSARQECSSDAVQMRVTATALNDQSREVSLRSEWQVPHLQSAR